MEAGVARTGFRKLRIVRRCGRHCFVVLPKRWIVERTLAWLARFRRLTIRYERRADLHLAFTTLACALICRTQAKRFCP